ncbi:MAG TPA: hypothetical protein VGK73_04365 [Polyangiaceae bacterium]
MRHSIAALLVLAFAASGCAVESGESAAEEAAAVGVKVAVPSQEIFEYAPAGEEIEYVKQVPALTPKGSITLPFAPAHTVALTITPNQTVNFSTNNGSAGVDPVLVLFMRHDNSTVFSQSPYTQQVGTTVLAINDDTNGLHPSISYRNTKGFTLNARLMVFAYNQSTGTATLNGPGGATTVSVTAGGFPLQPGTTGTAFTNNTNQGGVPGGDPWLFTFGTAPGNPQGDGNWQDDKANGVRDSLIQGNPTDKVLWYVVSGFNTGTTTVNN